MPTSGCLHFNIELPPDMKTCESCKKRSPKWHDKPALFGGIAAEPVANCIHFCLKYRKKKPKK